MTAGAPVPTSTAACPLPPSDLAGRPVPTITFATTAIELLRIHQSAYDPVFYTRRGLTSTVYRFDAPHDEYGVLYVSRHFDVCISETLIRNRFQAQAPVLQKSELAIRSIASLKVVDQDKLVLADLSAPLFTIGGSTEICSTGDYHAPNAWSLALHEPPAAFDGIYFPARYTNQPSIVLFDHVTVKVTASTPLLSDPRLPPFLDKYKIALL